MEKKILIVNSFGIGDVIFSTPLIEILKKHFPKIFIGYVCNKRVSGVLATNPCIDKIFVYEKDSFRDAWKESKITFVKKMLSFLSTIKNEKFGISIDLSLGYQYSMFLKLIGIKRRIGFNYRNRGKFLTDKINIDGFDKKHVVDYYLDMMRLLNIDVNKYEIRPRVYADGKSKKRADEVLRENKVNDKDLLIGLMAGCGASWGMDAKYRRWDKKKFADLADELIARHGAKIILLGNKKETEICKDVQASMKNDVINYCGKTSIGEFIALISKCSLIITNDGGPLHMAVGLGVPAVAIFGPVDEKVYGPYPSDNKHVVISKKNLACRPCYVKFKYKRCEDRRCLDLITVEEVLKAAEEILKR